jgi:hypothetical protein
MDIHPLYFNCMGLPNIFIAATSNGRIVTDGYNHTGFFQPFVLDSVVVLFRSVSMEQLLI